MTVMCRYRVTWTGFSGAPGISTFYGVSGSPPPDLNPFLYTFFNANRINLPNVVHINFPTTADQIEDTTGALVGAVSRAAQAEIVGQATGAYLAPSGYAVRWDTSTIADGHRLAGMTYFVPMQPDAGNGTGGLNSGIQSSVTSAAAALVASAGFNMLLWHRPLRQKVPPHAIIRNGSSGVVTSGRCLPQIVVLRSRRD